MHVLVLNCGSSTVKFQLIETDAERIRSNADACLARGLLDRVGEEGTIAIAAEDGVPVGETATLADHRAAIDRILRWIETTPRGLRAIGAVGHRVVHGGQRFRASVRIDREVVREIEACIPLAPLHNPANLDGIRAITGLLGATLPQVAVFDTAFHATLPEHAALYAIPYEQARRRRIRRYGFHGTSHRYVSERYCELGGVRARGTRLVTLHLGNGCSASAIRDGASVDTSMGFTPLEGLVMGTRCGDLDASVAGYIAESEGMTWREVESLLNERSGLVGLSGVSSDMRDLLEAEAAGNERAALAIEIFCYRARKYVGAYVAALGGADAVVFTGGIGENSPVVRERICAGLGGFGLELDADRNARATGGKAASIAADGARIDAWVIPTDEELLIARDTYRIAAGG